MSESKWKVIGASGFVGSSIVARLNAEGISVDPIEAPRLATRALDVDSIIDEADQLEGIIDSLAEAFAGAQVVAPSDMMDGRILAIREALEDGNINPKTVVHINAHATSTPAGDLPEATAMHETFGEHTKNIAVSATKSMTGHLLGGAGALEAVLTVLALHHRTAPCTINLDNKDPQIDLDVVTEARELPAGEIVALSNSFGFGGHNAVVAFRSVED